MTMGVVGPIDASLDDARNRMLRTARRRYPEYPIGDLEAVEGGLIVDRGSGNLFRVVRSEVIEAKYESVENVAGFFVDADGSLVFLRRAEEADTLDELQQQQAQEQRQQAQAREREQAAHDAFIKAQPLVAVKLSDLEGQPLPTVRQAALEIEASGGQLQAENGHLIVSLPQRLRSPSTTRGVARRLLRACRVLFVAGDVVAAELQNRSRKPLAERLPDKAVLAGGGVEA